MRDDSFNRLISQFCSVYCLNFIPQRLITTYFLSYMISHAWFQCHLRQHHFSVTRHSFFRERLDFRFTTRYTTRYITRWYNERNVVSITTKMIMLVRIARLIYFVAKAVNNRYRNMLTTLLFLQSLEIIYRWWLAYLYVKEESCTVLHKFPLWLLSNKQAQLSNLRNENKVSKCKSIKRLSPNKRFWNLLRGKIYTFKAHVLLLNFRRIICIKISSFSLCHLLHSCHCEGNEFRLIEHQYFTYYFNQ